MDWYSFIYGAAVAIIISVIVVASKHAGEAVIYHEDNEEMLGFRFKPDAAYILKNCKFVIFKITREK